MFSVLIMLKNTLTRLEKE